MIKTKYFYFLFLLLAFESFSQDSEDRTDFMTNSDQIIQVDRRDRKVRGYRYVKNKFTFGQIESSKKSVFFKFDALLGELEIKVDEKSSVYLIKRLGNKISFIDKAYKVFKDEDDELNFFLISDNCTKNCLLVKEKKKLSEAVIPENGYQKYKPPTYSKVKETYYVSFDGENAIKIPTKKKLFFKFFGDKEKDIKSFMKKRKLKRKNKEDLVKIINFYKTL